MTNETFRTHVTSTGFALNLSKAQMFHLVANHAVGFHRFGSEPAAAFRSMNQNYIASCRALVARGLFCDAGHAHPAAKDGFYSRITKAGHIVIELLQEAGLYEEYASAWSVDTRAAQSEWVASITTTREVA